MTCNLRHSFATAKLHSEIKEISFRHKHEIMRQFNDVLGLFEIDHISIDIANPNDELVLFSTTPSMPFNLINSGLWIYDGSLSPRYYKEWLSYFWEDTYYINYKNRIKVIKEVDYKFTFGFSLVRKIDDFHIIYSFATRNTHDNIKLFFSNNIENMFRIGDYCYKKIRNTYSIYSGGYTPPLITDFVPYNVLKKRIPFLHVITNPKKR